MSYSVKLKGLDRQLALLKAYPVELQASATKLLRDQARLLVSSSGSTPGMVQVMPPQNRVAGLSGTSAKRRGEQKIQGDIRRVLATAAYAYDTIRTRKPSAAAAFWFLIKKAQYAQAQQILREFGYNQRLRNAAVVGNPDLSLHQKARRRGSVPKNQPALQVVANAAKVNAYTRKVKQRVGMLASAPAAAVGSRYGPLRGVPAWVARHRSRWGVAYEKKVPGGVVIVLGVAAPFVVAGLQRRFDYVLSYRVKALNRQLPFVIRSIERQLGRKFKL